MTGKYIILFRVQELYYIFSSMIGKLTGTIDSFADGYLILDVQGVGYLVHASRRTLAQIGQKGARASLLIDTAMREDAITLYGFADTAEQQWFRLLTSVQGVGAKVGLAILSACAPDKIALAISAQDKTALTQADGVGPKLAVRIVTELKDKAGKLAVSAMPVSEIAKNTPHPKGTSGQENDSVQSDALSALVNLGYNRSEAYSAVLQAQGQGANDLQSLIRVSLKMLSG